MPAAKVGSNTRTRCHRLLAVLVAAFASACASNAPTRSPQTIADELLAADRAFSDSAAGDLLDGLSRAFATDVRLLAPGRWVHGRDSALAVLRGNPANVGARAAWTPVRAGISADGSHGFTVGYQTIQYSDTTRYARYVAYWIRGTDGWRMAAYKRIPAPPPPTTPPLLDSSLPDSVVAANPSSDELAAYRESLHAAEVAFSDDAGRRGIGMAFRAFGAPDAMNVGSPNDTVFRRGPEEIAQGVEVGTQGVALSWAPDEVLVAPSGDLGLSMGMITINAEGAPVRRVPFLTVWRRTSRDAPWRYVAE